MNREIILAIDSMGGDKAPISVIQGLALFCEKNPKGYFHIYGNKSKLQGLLDSYSILKDRYQLFHTDEVVTDDEQPVRALKKFPNSSMRLAINDVKSGKAHACVSAGNTGALMVIAKMVLGSIEGIKRPAIAAVYPNLEGGCVLLDMGANAECDPIHLFQFGVMGSCFAQVVLNKKFPSIGILNVGHEEHKGRDLDKKAHALLKGSTLNYYGFIESYDVFNNVVDVVVTDGFTGNIALKIGEGAANVLKKLLKSTFKTSWLTKIAAVLVTKELKKNMRLIDPNAHNGAMFIGLNGIVMKSHGSSDGEAFFSAVTKAYNLADQDVNKRLGEVILSYDIQFEENQSIVSKIINKLGL